MYVYGRHQRAGFCDAQLIAVIQEQCGTSNIRKNFDQRANADVSHAPWESPHGDRDDV